MKQHALFFLFFLLCLALPAQKCATYECMMTQGQTAFNKKDFVTAFKKFKGAKAFLENEDKIRRAEADKWIEKTFEGIDAQREEANNKKIAEENERKTKKLLEEVKFEKIKTEEALTLAERNALIAKKNEDSINILLVRVQQEKERTEEALTLAERNALIAKKNEDSIKILLVRVQQEKIRTEEALIDAAAQRDKNKKIINALYFYSERYAVSIKYINSLVKYGFIDKNGNVMIDFQYDEALPFEYNGLAKVKKGDDNYLIDTLGNEYKVAYNRPISNITHYEYV